MRRTITLTLVLSLSTHVATIAMAQRRASFTQARAAAVSGDSKTKLPTVREVDAAGVKKLLQRGEGTNARPLLLNVWATWCDPCREEFPDLVKIDEDYRARGLDFIALSVDDVAEINKGVPAFLQQMRAHMPAYLLNTPEPTVAINMVDPTWGGEVPATFLFDRTGKLAFKHTGRIKPDELRAAIDKVIDEK
ncbi:MAG: TlpA family protein disulfide reductase [Pyrinomonadaceae bacterium]|nr:TlpA family protein disulfide reductase [Pyrinomonadaceae bacterium]